MPTLATSGIRSAPRRVLMIAFHFPPLTGSSGVQRTLRFVQHLPAHGWQPLVLSAHPRAYENTAVDLLAEVPDDTVVQRAFALDAARHLAVKGRYSNLLALPDRWSAWALGAIPTGLQMIRKYRPDVIWSTFPIATAHLIAHWLHRLTGLPLVVDFRDPMAQEGYPTDPRVWRSFERIEQATLRAASRAVFVTPSARAMYRTRYPFLPHDRFVLVENGYDEECFVAAERAPQPASARTERLRLLHSGIVYPSERDPSALFQALGRMRSDGRISAATLRLRFRAPVSDELLRRLASESHIEDLIEILPALPYQEALREMLDADGLLLMQGSNCDEQIPAKLYEYFRARRPILGLAAPGGDTGRAMIEAGVTHVARLEDTQAVEVALTRYLAHMQRSPAPPLAAAQLSAMSRRARAAVLAAVLDEVRAGAAVVCNPRVTPEAR